MGVCAYYSMCAHWVYPHQRKPVIEAAISSPPLLYTVSIRWILLP